MKIEVVLVAAIITSIQVWADAACAVEYSSALQAAEKESLETQVTAAAIGHVDLSGYSVKPLEVPTSIAAHDPSDNLSTEVWSPSNEFILSMGAYGAEGDGTRRHVKVNVAKSVVRSPTPLLQFDIFSYPGSTQIGDLDLDGAVGLNHIVTARNTAFKISTKSGGLISSISALNFWASVLPRNTTAFDPQVTYDASTGHYFVSAVNSPNAATGGGILFGVTEVPEMPTGTWRLFRIDPSPGNNLIVDRVGLGVSTQLVGITFLSYKGANSPPAAVSGISVAVILKGWLLTPGYPFFSNVFVNAVTSGSLWYPARLNYSSASVTSHSDDLLLVRPNTQTSLQVYRISSLGFSSFLPDFVNSTVVNAPIPLYGTSTLPGNIQMASSVPLSDGVYANSSLWGSQLLIAHGGVGLNSPGAPASAVAWVQLDLDSGLAVGSGTVEGEGESRSYLVPSVAHGVNGAALGFTTSSQLSYPSAGYATRGPGPSNVFNSAHIYRVGLAPKPETYLGSGHARMGDYSVTAPDPSNPCHFWTAQEAQLGTGEETITWAKFSVCSN